TALPVERAPRGTPPPPRSFDPLAAKTTRFGLCVSGNGFHGTKTRLVDGELAHARPVRGPFDRGVDDARRLGKCLRQLLHGPLEMIAVDMRPCAIVVERFDE